MSSYFPAVMYVIIIRDHLNALNHAISLLCTHTHVQAHVCAHKHAHTQTHKHTHARTHAHTHARMQLRINGKGGGSERLTGKQIMGIWDGMCTLLCVRQVSVEDVSSKSGMLLRMLHAAAHELRW